MIDRISPASLQKIIAGKMSEPGPCVIKFYSNNCHYCISLKDRFHKIASRHPDINFFAFNIQDHPNLDSIIKLNGVPSIVFVKNECCKHDPVNRISILEDPKEPHEVTWYYPGDIIEFIESNK